jgi:peptidoglycan/LPS O-acetylase OafA/YrhL
VFSANLRAREIPSLTGLRAVAAMVVVCTHVTGLQLLGRHAVTLFFVLSGFLITFKLLEEFERSGKIDIAAFYKRRIRRLAPAYYVCLAVTAVWMRGVPGELRAAILYLSDYYNAWIREGAILHLWSLSVEEHFYLLWPAALLFLVKTRRRYWVMGVVIAIVQTARFFLASRHPLYFYYSFEVRLDGLLAGAMLAFLLRSAPAAPRWIAGRWLWIPAVAVFATRSDTLAVYASALLIACTVYAPPLLLNNRVTQFLGERSYSLYLYHVMVRGVYMGLVPGAADGSFAVHGWGNRFAVIALSIGAAAISYTYVEEPLRRGRSPGAKLAPAPAYPAVWDAPKTPAT